MTAPKPLIIQSFLGSDHARVPPAASDTVVVVTYADARTALFTGRPRWRDRRGASRFDVVDVSDHVTRTSTHLPTHGDVYRFGADVTIAWHVYDAGEVVRRRAVHGDDLALGYVLEQFRSLSRRYQAKDVAGAEESLRRALPLPVRLPSGLEIIGISAALTVDQRLARRVTDRDEALHTTDIDQIDVTRLQDRADRLRPLVQGPQGAVLVHLAQHPEDTGSVLQLMVQGRNEDRAHHLALLDRLLQNEFVQEADVAPLRAALLGSVPGAWNPVSRPMLDPPVTPAPQALPSASAPSATAAFDPSATGNPEPEPEDQDPAAVAQQPSPPADGVVGWRSVGRRSP